MDVHQAAMSKMDGTVLEEAHHKQIPAMKFAVTD